MNSFGKEVGRKPKTGDVHVEFSSHPISEQNKSIREPVKLIFEIMFLVLIFFPMLIWSLFSYIFTRRESVEGKVVMITGTNRGLGRALAEKFAQLGCKLACVARDLDSNEETVKMINQRYPNITIKTYKCNLASSDEIHALKEAVKHDFEHVDILINNAAVLVPSFITTFEDSVLNDTINVNLRSHFFMMREFLPDMIQRNEGHIVAIGSMGSFNCISNSIMYVAAKHGLLGLMDCLHFDLQRNPKNAIKTTIVCPYFINTNTLCENYWKIRIPKLSIEEVVESSVNGILKNRKMVTVPGGMYFASLLLKLLPEKLEQIIRQIFYTDVAFGLQPEDINQKFIR